MKVLINLAAIIAAPVIGFWVFAVMFNYSYEGSASLIVNAAIVNSVLGLLLGLLGRFASSMRASVLYLISSWVFILICIGNLFGNNPIGQTWLISLSLLIGGFFLSLLAKPKRPESENNA